jgi:hypothetical protein
MVKKFLTWVLGGELDRPIKVIGVLALIGLVVFVLIGRQLPPVSYG